MQHLTSFSNVSNSENSESEIKSNLILLHGALGCKKQFEDFYKEIKIDVEVKDLQEKREILQKDIVNKLAF